MFMQLFRQWRKMCVVAILKWVAVTINTILLVFGIIVAIFGALLWKTDLTEYPEEVDIIVDVVFYFVFCCCIGHGRSDHHQVPIGLRHWCNPLANRISDRRRKCRSSATGTVKDIVCLFVCRN